MNVIEWKYETHLEKLVRYGLVAESAIPVGLRRIAEQTRLEKLNDF